MIVQGGPRSRSTGNFSDGVINHVVGVITTSRNGTAIGSFELPKNMVFALDTKNNINHHPVKPRAKQQQVIETRFTAC
jgi:hypothetical protein